MRKWLISIISDDSGRFSLSKFLHLSIGICGMAISWKLVVLGGYNEMYFLALLAYGMGQQTLNKFLDVKSGKYQQRAGRIETHDTTVDVDVSVNGPMRKAP